MYLHMYQYIYVYLCTGWLVPLPRIQLFVCNESASIVDIHGNMSASTQLKLASATTIVCLFVGAMKTPSKL